MEKIQITKPLYSPKQNSTKLYYKKNVYHRKKLMNSLSNVDNKNPRKRNIIGNENFNNFSNIKSYITKEEQYNISNARASINITFKTNINHYSYKNINKCNLNTKSIILIQKFVRGFLAKKKFKSRREILKLDKHKYKNYLTKNTLNSIHKHVNKSSNVNILYAIKQNSFRQKNTIKYVNNMLNNNRHSVIEKCKINNRFKNNLLLIPKGNKNYSLDHMKCEDNADKDYKTYRDNHKNNIFKKPIELIDKKNYNNNLIEPDEASFYTSNKRTTSKPLKDIDSIDINFNEKKIENNIETNIELSDLSLSSEQCPQNVNKNNKNNKINEDEVLDSYDEDEKNLNINNEYFENESKNVVNKLEKNTLHNNKNLNNLYNEKSNKYKGIPYIKIMSNTSSNPTKENTSSDKILENEINCGLDSSRNKNSMRTIKAINDNNVDNKKRHKKHKSKSKNKNKEKIKEDKAKHKDKDKFKDKEKDKNKVKDKEKSDKKKHKKHSKTKSNNNNFNSFKNLHFDSKNILNYNKVFPYNIKSDNNKQNLLKNMCIGGINNNFLNNKNSKMNESIKEDKQKETDTNDIKSSFYDHEDFAIISYDYSLNDKKKKLTINNVVNIIIKGGINKMKFIKTLESVIRNNIYHFIFNYLKEKFFKNEEDDNDDSSMTINDSCSFIPCKRIEKKNIIFEYAKTDITKKNKISSNNRKINIKRDLININDK